ncbi:MAG: NAD(P)-binding domain-containing protein, partial [Armatimonadota bacterium]
MATTYDLGVIGAGMMGSALVRAFLNAGLLQADRVIMSDVYPAALTALAETLGVQTTDDNGLLVGQSAVVMRAVKPRVMAAAL